MSTLHPLRTQLTSGLAIAARQWMRLIEVAMAAQGDPDVSAACAVPLILIGRSGGGMRQVALAEQMGVVGPSLVRLLDQLCAADLVRREEDQRDRRAKTLWLTKRGIGVSQRLEQGLQQLRQQVFAKISEADLQAALRVQQAIAEATSALEPASLRRRRGKP